MDLKVSQKRCVFIAFVLFTLLHTVVMKIGCSLSRLPQAPVKHTEHFTEQD